MIEQRSGAGLSTADMVAGMEGRSEEQAAVTEAKRPEDGAFPTERPTEVDGRTVRNGATATTPTASGDQTPLLSEDKAAAFRARWDAIQASFVDEPRQSVEQADGLVAEAIKHLAEVFAQERSTLEEQWSRGDEVSTDALRLGLQRYRSFFQRLLAV
jgi:hypothetical protein